MIDGRVVDLREGGVRAAGRKCVRIGSGEGECAADEGRVQLDIVGVEDFAERNVRFADVILEVFVVEMNEGRTEGRAA